MRRFLIALRRMRLLRRLSGHDAQLAGTGARCDVMAADIAELRTRAGSMAPCAGGCGCIVERGMARIYKQEMDGGASPPRTISVCRFCKRDFELRHNVRKVRS